MFYQKSILFVFALLLSPALFAITTWTGGGANNLWNNTANWDTGVVPTSADDVIIPAGSGLVKFNYVNRRARSLEINVGSTVRVNGGCRLTILTAIPQALINHGGLNIRGELILRNATVTGLENHGTLTNQGLISMDNLGGVGLFNDGRIYNRATGTMNFLAGGSFDIRSELGLFVNEGLIEFLTLGTGDGMTVGNNFRNRTTGRIEFGSGHAGRFIVNGNPVLNEGFIGFTNSTSPGTCIFLGAATVFENSATGTIDIDNFGGTAAMTLVGTAIFKNKGGLTIHSNGTRDGIHLNGSGSMVNESGGSITMDGLDNGILSPATTLLENYGAISIADVTTGIRMDSDVSNFSDGTIHIDSANSGIINNAPGIFTNTDAAITFTNINTWDIINWSSFYNLGCGIINGDKLIVNNNVFENDGWMIYDSNGLPHNGFNQILNTGIVVDPFNRFFTSINNQEAWVTPLVSPQANVAYPNTFEIANITTSTILDEFFLDPGLSISAGTYDHAANIFTPTNAAIGATELYTKGIQACTRLIRIRVIGGVLPIVQNKPAEQLMYRQGSTHSTALNKLKLFPNPTTGIFQAQLPALEATTYELQVLNAQGQIMAQQQGDANYENGPTFDLSEYPAGMYWTRLLADGKLIAQEKIIRLR